MKKLTFKAGEFIYHEKKPGVDMYLITSGKVESIREMGDDKIVLEVLGRNSFFGEMALFGDSWRETSIRAIEDTEVIIVNKQIMQLQFKKIPEWFVSIINTIAQRILTTKKGIKSKVRVSLDYSIIKIINLLLDEHGGYYSEKGKEISLSLIRDEICSILGIPEKILDSRLQRLNRYNLVSVKGSSNQLLIPDEERLTKYSQFLLMQSREGSKFKHSLSADDIRAFIRMHKVLKE